MRVRVVTGLVVAAVALAVVGGMTLGSASSNSRGTGTYTAEDFTTTDAWTPEDYATIDALKAEMVERVETWASRLQISQMSVEELESGIDVITEWIVSTEGQWRVTAELDHRRLALCHELPETHPYRAPGELC